MATYIGDDRDTQVLHVVDDELLLHRDLGMLNQLGQILLRDACK